MRQRPGGRRVRQRRRRRPEGGRTPPRRPCAGGNRRLSAAVDRRAPGDPVELASVPTDGPPLRGPRPPRHGPRPRGPARRPTAATTGRRAWAVTPPETTSMPPGRASSPVTTRRSMSRGARGPRRRSVRDPRPDGTDTLPHPGELLRAAPEDQLSLLDGLDTFGANLPDEESEGFTPPAPPPLPRPSRPTVLGIAGIVAGLIVFLSPGVLPVGEDTALLLGFCAIVDRLRDSHLAAPAGR